MLTTLPQMDSDPVASGRTRDLVRIGRTTTVAEAGAHLRITGNTCAVVFSHGRPIGLVTQATLADAVGTGDADAPVGAVMDYVAVPVDAGADAQSTVATFTTAAWEWLRTRKG
jgi:predicted transcriptional regulator